MSFLEFRQFREKDGTIIPIEFSNELPFLPRRMFYISDVPEHESRGNHAHRSCHQILIPIKGSFNLAYEGREGSGAIIMCSPKLAFHAKPLTWMKLEGFSQDAVLLVLASDPYDPKDYIHSYEDFKNLLHPV